MKVVWTSVMPVNSSTSSGSKPVKSTTGSAALPNVRYPPAYECTYRLEMAEPDLVHAVSELCLQQQTLHACLN